MSLKAKFDSIMRVVSADLGIGSDLTALTPDRREDVQNVAEQAILDWAARREAGSGRGRPITNFQHLLEEYCAIADHL